MIEKDHIRHEICINEYNENKNNIHNMQKQTILEFENKIEDIKNKIEQNKK